MSIPAALTARSLQSPVDMDTWHRRFAHFGVSRVKDASKLVDGLEIVKKESSGQCEDCILATLISGDRLVLLPKEGLYML